MSTIDNTARWELDVAATADETLESMVMAGKGAFAGVDHIVLLVYSVFSLLLAPVGATMVLWVAVHLAGGPAFSDLPVWGIPVTLLVFAGIAIWLSMRLHALIAKMTVRSRFGGGQRVTLDASGVTLVTQHSRWHSGWRDVAMVGGGKECLVIGVSGVAFPVPRRALLGPQDADDALAHCRAWQEAAQ